MAVKIPQYENRLTPSGGLSVNASAPPVSNAIGAALSNVGTALNQAAGFEAKGIEELNKRADQDDLLRAQTALVRMNEDITKYATDLSMSVEPGAYGYADKIRSSVQDYTKKLLEEGGWRENTKKHLLSKSLQLEESMYGQAVNYEAKAGVDLRLSQINQNAEYYQRFLLQNPDKYDETMSGIDSMIDNAALTPQMKQKLKDDYRKNIALTTAAAIQEKDPELAKQLYTSAYGVTAGENSGPAPYQERTAPIPKAAPIELPKGAKLPAGMRNNNPGNIKFVGQKDAIGPSENLDQGDPQAVYKTPEDGLKAMYRLVLKKYDGGKTTVSDLIAGNGGWTPGNNQAAANIARTMGIKATDPVDLRNPDTLAKFGRALITQEQGTANKYINDDQLTAAAGAALGKGAAVGSAITLPSVTVTPDKAADLPPWAGRLIQDIGPEKLPQLIASAESDVNRLRTQFKATVITQEANDISMFQDGKVPPKELSLDDYERAFGAEEGAIRYQNYQSVKTLGTDKLAVRTMSIEQQDRLLKSYEPDASRPEFYDAAKTRQAVLAQAINETRAERYKDPITFAMKNKIGDLKPLDFNDMPAVGAELSKRFGVATEMTRAYGTPFQVMTPDEKGRMLEGFGKLTDQGKIAFLATMSSSIVNKDVYRAIVQQIAPDSPVTAVVGNLVGLSNPAVFKDSHWFGPDTTRAAYDPKQVALTILQGEQLLNPSAAANKTDGRGTALKMPKEDDLRTEFDAAVAGAFNNQSKEYAVTYQAVKGYYAAKSAQAGEFAQDKVNMDRFREAVEAVTGGVTEVNSKTNVRRPWGMPEDVFLDQAKTAFDAEIKRLGLNWNYSHYGLENAGDGYLVRVGNGYATYTDKNGNLRSVYITIGQPRGQSQTGIITPAPGANSKVDINKDPKLGTK